MNSVDIENKVLKHLTAWEHFDKTRFFRSNRKFEPPNNGIWQVVSIVGGINRIQSMSDKPCILQLGTVIVQVFAHIGLGTQGIKMQADSLANHLACYTDGKLELLAPSIINADASNGFYQINVSVPYRYY
ncbi:DUF4128 domain-containing protein [Moraxella nasibovis]|uniref:phage tail terminator-like protein n=1 Tax=Moraxella nasibovis TaxID=2904120 RepID=UPI002410413E|nr:phage tail terminator-like protein [Moraxella nasibovis]WFF39291.1 DUF4128 domain-containing protein [Moraxella nasibovis]